MISAFRTKAVSDSGLREKVPRPGGIVFELLAELPHVHAEVLGLSGVGQPPHGEQDLFVSQDFPRVAHHRGEELVLRRREANLSPGEERETLVEVDAQRTHVEGRLQRVPRLPLRVPQPYANSSEELAAAERLRQVV